MVKKIDAAEFESAVASGVAVVDFSAIWCGPCKMLAPVLEEISEEMAGDIQFFNVDVDTNVELAEKFGISSIPALLVLKDGEKQDLKIGFQPKEMLVEYLNGFKAN